MYQGEVSITKEDLSSFLEVAEDQISPSVHEGAQYSCHKCKYKATHLNTHVKAIHEQKRDQCDQKKVSSQLHQKP